MDLSNVTPQGGVLSPPIGWNLAFNKLLKGYDNSPTHAEGFADDESLTCRGTDLNTVLGTAQDAIDKAVTWANSCGLKLWHTKMVAVIFTNLRKFPNPLSLGFTGRKLNFPKV
jgi:hypothetical protein